MEKRKTRIYFFSKWAKDTHPINLNDPHIVPFNPEIKHGEGAHVHDAEAVGLAGRERKGRVFVEADSGGGIFCGWGGGGGGGYRGEVSAVVREVD